MKRLFPVAASVALLAFGGCAHDRAAAGGAPDGTVAALGQTNAPSPDANLIVTPDRGLSGKVAWVNGNLRFVVLTFPVGQLPQANQRLDVYRAGLKVGELKVSGPQIDENVVADIIAGDAQVGDAVRNE